MSSSPQPRSATLSVEVGGQVLPVRVRVSPRAVRLTLRYIPRDNCLTVTAPPGVTTRFIRGFVSDHADWIGRRLTTAPGRVPFLPGHRIPVAGQDRLITHDPQGRRGITLTETALILTGPVEKPENRVRDYLTRLARQEITACCQSLSPLAEGRVRRITVRDTRSRWGSCSTLGDLSFSWRLVMAPPPVLRYVVAHELAHLAEMNHSPRFWAEVARLMPDHAVPRDWLKRHGSSLHLYG